MKLYTIGEVSKIIGVPIARIAYHHITGRLPEPKRFASDRCYEEGDLSVVRDYFDRTPPYARQVKTKPHSKDKIV